MYILAAVPHVQNLLLEAGALTLLADKFDVRQKLHLNCNGASPLANFTAPTGQIEGKM